MTTYRIIGPSFVASLSVEEGTIISSDTLLDWSLGRPWTWLLNYCNLKGWTIQPQIDKPAHVAEIELEGVVYELYWNNNRLQRITLHRLDGEEEDVTINDIPDELRDLIE